MIDNTSLISLYSPEKTIVEQYIKILWRSRPYSFLVVIMFINNCDEDYMVTFVGRILVCVSDYDITLRTIGFIYNGHAA